MHMDWIRIGMIAWNLAFLVWCVFFVRRLARESRRPLPRPRLVVVDSGVSAIIGKPTRSQWRLRRRALQEAVQICEEFAEKAEEESGAGAWYVRAAARRIRDRLDEYDRASPEMLLRQQEFPRANRVA